MSKQPFLPLFFGDLLASTAAWDGEERSLYILLLAYQWTSGPLPKDPKRIARMCQYEWKKFQALWAVVGAKFVDSDDGLINLRLEEHREKSERISKINEERAKAGAAKRWGNAPSNAPSTNNGDAPSNAQSNAAPDAIHPIPSHTQELRTRIKNPEVSHRNATPPEFEEVRQLYPKRGGGQRWPAAEKAYRARLAEGHTHAEMIAGVKRYAEFNTAAGKTGTEYVQMASTFFGQNKSFLEPWAPPRPPPDTRQLSAVERVKLANGTGAKRDERVVSEQNGQGIYDLDRLGGDVRQPLHEGIRRLGT